MKTWTVDSKTTPGKRYNVIQVNGKDGIYLHCDCPSWPSQVKNGGCKHVKTIALFDGISTGLPNTRIFSCTYCNLQFPTVTGMNIHVERWHKVSSAADSMNRVSKDDAAAAARILAWRP